MGSGFHSPFSVHVEDLGPMSLSILSLEQVKKSVVPSTADQFDDKLLYPWDVTISNE
jgi:hypothetical protein